MVCLQLQIGNVDFVGRQERYDEMIDFLNDDHGDSRRDDVEFFCRPPGEVDDSSANKRTAVGDTDDDTTAVGRVVNLKHGAEGIAAVGTRQAVGVQPFATGGAATVETLCIEGGLTLLRLLCVGSDK